VKSRFEETCSNIANQNVRRSRDRRPVQPVVLYSALNVCSANIVEKEFEDVDSVDTSNRLTTIPLKADNRNSERSYERNLDLFVTNSLRDAAHDHFSSQRENFANLYISRPPTENDDVIYGDVARDKQTTSGDNFAVYDNRFAGNTSMTSPSQPSNSNLAPATVFLKSC